MKNTDHLVDHDKFADTYDQQVRNITAMGTKLFSECAMSMSNQVNLYWIWELVRFKFGSFCQCRVKDNRFGWIYSNAGKVSGKKNRKRTCYL